MRLKKGPSSESPFHLVQDIKSLDLWASSPKLNIWDKILIYVKKNYSLRSSSLHSCYKVICNTATSILMIVAVIAVAAAHSDSNRIMRR